MRPAVHRISVAALLAGPTALAFFSGGFFTVPRLWAGLVACTLVVAAALVSPRPLPASAAGRAAIAGLGLLAAWTLISLAWAPLGGPAWHDAQRLALYAGALVAAAALLREPAVTRAVEPALAAGALLIAVYALSERLLPGVFDLSSSAAARGRLDQPLTYWNATGTVLAVGLVLAARIAGTPERARAMRRVAAGALPWLACATYLTLSRGALAALAVGLLVLVAAAPTRAQLRAVGLGIAVGVPAAVASEVLPGVADLTGGHREAGGLAMLAVLLVLSAAAVLASALGGRGQGGRLGGRGVLAVRAAAVALIIAGIVVTASNERPPDSGEQARGGAQRLSSLESNRYEYWKVAVKGLGQHPLAGGGSGSFRVLWLRERDVPESVEDAHSLVLETGAELGLVGLALLALFLGGIGVAATRAARASPVLGPGAMAGLAVWAFHAQLDWIWEMPAATLPALVLAGLAISLSEEPAGSAAPTS